MVLLPEVVDVTCKGHRVAQECEKKTRKENKKGIKRKMPPSEEDVPESGKDLQ